jgi:hypothetical protein
MYDELEGDELGEDEIILAGYDDLEGDELGFNPFAVVARGARAVGRRIAGRGRGGGAQRAMVVRRPQPMYARNQAQIDAANRANALRQYQPDARGDALDQIVPFSAATLTAAAPTATLNAFPQRAFMLRRLVISLGRVGATALTALVTVTQLTVGADPQFVATGAIPADMFANTAVGVRLKPNAARPGITIFLGMAAAGLVAPDTVAVSAAGIGPAIG